MDSSKLSIIVVFMAAVFFCAPANAQTEIFDENGDKIVLMPDGTWRYATTGKEAKSPKIETPKSDVSAKISKSEKKKNKSAEKQAKLQEKLNQKLEKETRIALADSTPNGENHTVLLQTDVKQPASSINDLPEKAIVQQKSTNATSKQTKPDVLDKKKEDKNGYKPFKEKKYQPAPLKCGLIMNEVDAFTKKRKVATESKFFFGYTNEALIKFMDGNHYLTCEGYVAQVQGHLVYSATITIDAPRGQEEYGALEEGTLFALRTVDGRTINLTTRSHEPGRVNRDKGITVYQVEMGIDPRTEKILRKSEVAEVRIVWENGYQDYQVSELDYFKDLLICLGQGSENK